MHILEIIVIGVALALDAFAVTVANCLEYKENLSKIKAWAMPVTFSAFQILMPLAGYFIGNIFYEYIASFSKFLTAGIFFILAVKIAFDAFNDKKENYAKPQKPFDLTTLLTQGVATSIDALAIGVTFSVELSFSVWFAALIIGGVTFLIVAAALFIGKNLGKLLGKYSVWVGAVILFALAVKNLREGFI